MTARAPLLVLVPVVYVAVALACRVLTFGTFVLDRETLTLMAVVPSLQVLALAGARRLWHWRRRRTE